MVLNCVAYGCNVVHDARSKISFHAFPFKRPEILKLWIAAVRRENWHPSKTSKLCGKHFVATDYLIKPGCTAKLLKPDAVPSVFLFPKHLIKKVPLPRRKMLKKNEDTASSTSQIEVMDISYESSTPIALQHLNFALRVGEKFKFPANAHEKAVWLEKLGLKEFTVSKYARICSIHFKAEAFQIKPGGKIFLRKGARPLFFNDEYIPPTKTASTSRLDNRKSSTDSTDTAPETNCLDIIDSFDPPLKRQPPENSGQPNVEFVATTESKIDVLDIKNEPLEPLFIPETSSMPTVECLPEHVSTITGKHDVLDIKNEPLEPHIASIPGTSSQPTIEFLPEHVPTITGQVTETSKKPATKKNISNKIICRMCLEPVTKNQMVPLSLIDVNYPGKSESFKQSKAVKIEKVVSMILVVMPNFDFDVAYNPIICHKCNAHLESAFNFVQGCRANEKLIHLYKAKLAPNEELISCDDVAQQKEYLMKEMPPRRN
ncbi:hypothetical protein JTB14_008665 [Gonioctena quinquepunctata]|nr:hypothetical protein JTB14_008665 [Gonioctena quinquepunctata]